MKLDYRRIGYWTGWALVRGAGVGLGGVAGAATVGAIIYGFLHYF